LEPELVLVVPGGLIEVVVECHHRPLSGPSSPGPPVPRRPGSRRRAAARNSRDLGGRCMARRLRPEVDGDPRTIELVLEVIAPIAAAVGEVAGGLFGARVRRGQVLYHPVEFLPLLALALLALGLALLEGLP
jgi:hypothetical protein